MTERDNSERASGDVKEKEYKSCYGDTEVKKLETNMKQWQKRNKMTRQYGMGFFSLLLSK